MAELRIGLSPRGGFKHGVSVILANSTTSLLIVVAMVLKDWKERRSPAAALASEQLPERGDLFFQFP